MQLIGVERFLDIFLLVLFASPSAAAVFETVIVALIEMYASL